MAWIFWFALLFVSAIATVVYSAYRHAKLIEFSTGGHLLLGHENEIWREVAGFLEHLGEEHDTAA